MHGRMGGTGLRGAVAIFAAVACCLATTASASAAGLLLSAGGTPLAEGAGTEWVSDEFTLASVFGQATCASRGGVHWPGTVTPLHPKTTKGKTTYAKYAGTLPGEPASTGCLEPAGAITIAPGGAPWSFSFSNKGVATVKGSKKVEILATFAAFPGVKCVWEASKLIWHFALGGDGAPVPVQLTEQEQLLKSDKKQSSSICPLEERVSSRFELSAAGHAVVGEL